MSMTSLESQLVPRTLSLFSKLWYCIGGSLYPSRIYIGSGDLNCSPYVHVASTLSTEQSSHLFGVFNVHNFALLLRLNSAVSLLRVYVCMAMLLIFLFSCQI